MAHFTKEYAIFSFDTLLHLSGNTMIAAQNLQIQYSLTKNFQRRKLLELALNYSGLSRVKAFNIQLLQTSFSTFVKNDFL